mgnify:CR=1 FL=1
MCAKKSLISLHTFFVPRRVVVWFVLGWRVVVWFVLGRRVVVWFVLGQIPTRFYNFFLQNPMKIIVLRRIEDAGAV